jgi:hypothetical protein
LSVTLTVALLAAAVLVGAYSFANGGIVPNEALVCALLVGGGLQFVTRTYHSGAYAMRRVYRPLPSLLVLDIVSVGLLLGAWPFIGLWAFALAELASAFAVTAVTLHYTSRTYRTLALPTIAPLMRERRRLPSRRSLRAALAPGVSFALVGLEALIVVAGTTILQTGASTDLVVLLAVLAPVNRAGFEWARLLYFDLKKMDVPLLRSLRDRFDRASRRVALAMGGASWVIAAIGVLVVGGLSSLLVVALLAMFVARSLLASAQMQAFSARSYERLTVVGGFGVLALIGVFRYTHNEELQVFAIAAVLAASFVALLLTSTDTDNDERLLSMPDFLLRLRHVRGPVTVTRLGFDTRLEARGTWVLAGGAVLAGRDAAADRIAAATARQNGAAAWLSPTELWLYAPDGSADVPVALAAGLIDRSPARSNYAGGAQAARELATIATRNASPAVQTANSLIADFARRFPNGICYELSSPPPAALKALPADVRGEIYRDALAFAGQLKLSRRLPDLEVTSLVDDGVLRAVFVVDKAVDERRRKTWRNTLRDWMTRAAAGLQEAPSGESVPLVTPSEAGML